MITALVHHRGGNVALLGATLSALVTGVAQGVVADAVVIAPEASPDVATIADAAGATFVVAASEPWRTGAQAARRDWLLCLEAGDVPIDDWPRTLDRFCALAGNGAAIGRLVRVPARPRDWLALPFARLGSGPRAGDLAHRRHLEEGARPRIDRVAVRLVRERDLARA